jgi:hypothetical protein
MFFRMKFKTAHHQVKSLREVTDHIAGSGSFLISLLRLNTCGGSFM